MNIVYRGFLVWVTVLFFNSAVFSQITVDDSTFSVQQLVEDILIDSPCAQVDNITSFTGTEQGFNGIGYFEANGSGFEIDRGVILSTGNATSAAGPNGTDILSEGTFQWVGDDDLAAITNTPDLNNASFIQFDFIPTIDFISFNFLFASEEYIGSFPCSFSDVFAFILTDASGNSTNLAVIPNTDPAIPISVTTIHPGVDSNNDGDFADVGECEPQNPIFFNRNIVPGTDAPIDFNGYTQILNASGDVVPNQQYTIKLVIADNQDNSYDSAVFLQAGSFNLGGDLGDDLTISAGNPACIGTPVVLDATLGSGSTYTWTKDGSPLAPGDGTTVLNSGTQLEVTQDGTYGVVIEIASGCTASDEVEIEFVQPPVLANTPINLIDCSATGPISTFDLTQNTSVVLGAQDSATYVVSYHLTEQDAEDYNGTSTAETIDNSSAFDNTINDQVIWLRIAEVNQTCYEIASFSLVVVEDFSISTPTDYELCDTDADGSDTNGEVVFDLPSKVAEVIGTEDPANFVVSFYETQAAADAGVASTALPDAYTNTSNPQEIFARLEVIGRSDCYEITSFNLVVHALPVIDNEVDLLQCDDDSDGLSSFNLTEANPLISSNSETEIFEYYLTEQEAIDGDPADAIPNFTTYPNPSPLNSEVYARVININGCVRVSRIVLEVSATQIPSDFNLLYTVCESETSDSNPRDGIAEFDFSDATAQITALFPAGQNLTISYYQNEADALAEVNAIADISSYRNEASPLVQELYVRVENGDDNTCLGLGNHITLQVNPYEPLDIPEEFILCIGNDGTLLDTFPNTVVETGLDPAVYTFQWYTGSVPATGNEIAGATNPDFSTTTPGEYSIMITGITTGCTYTGNTRFVESFTQLPDNFNLNYTVCESSNSDENPFDGIATIDFSDATNQIAALFPAGQSLEVTYYQSEQDAIDEVNTITNISNYRNETSPFLQEIYVRIENDGNNSCLGIASAITLQVNPFEPVTLPEEFVLCLQGDGSIINVLPDPIIDTGLNSGLYSFQWYEGNTPTIGNEIAGATASSFSPTVAGQYSVLITGITTGCTYSGATNVVASYPPESVSTELLSGAFSNNASIEVTVVGNGTYQFRLDDGNWQESNIFANVSRGEHRIYVRDIKGCGEIDIEVEPIIDFPKYFTPNGDGIHDAWNIAGSENVIIQSVRIFDRMGKLLKQLNGSSNWDGTFNGRQLPSTEYWFVVSYIEENEFKEFKASFSLIR